MIGLVLTNDWELFGNGSGNFYEIQHNRLKKLLDTAEEFNAKITIMAEVGQQFGHKKIASKYIWAQKIVNDWENLIIEIVNRGHDVQLHLHPQWVNANFNGTNWELDYNKWAISSLEKDEIYMIIKEGKEYLESIIKPFINDYSCIAFRAGSYCIEPSRYVIEGLKKNGIMCDTSVIKYFKKDNYYDYNDAYSNFLPWYTSSNNIKKKTNKNRELLEMPIYTSTKKNYLLKKFYRLISNNCLQNSTDKKELINQNNNKYKNNNIKLEKRNNIIYLIKRLQKNIYKRNIVKLNYDELMPAEFIGMLKTIKKLKHLIEKKGEHSLILPIVAIGHVKEMKNTENIANILERIKKEMKNDIIYMTLTDAIYYWNKRSIKL